LLLKAIADVHREDICVCGNAHKMVIYASVWMYTVKTLNKAGLRYFNLSTLNKHLKIMKRMFVYVFVCVHLCVRKWGCYKAYRQSRGFY